MNLGDANQYQNSSNNINTLLNTNSGFNNINTSSNLNSNNFPSTQPLSSNRFLSSAQSINNLPSRVVSVQNNSANNSTYKETSSQTDMTLNLLSLNKDNKYQIFLILLATMTI